MAKPAKKNEMKNEEIKLPEIKGIGYTYDLVVPLSTMKDNSIHYDMMNVKAFCTQLKDNFTAHFDHANKASKHYLQYAIETRNCDLIRMLWEALPSKYQPMLAAWVKACTNGVIVKRSKSHTDAKGAKVTNYSFGIDKKAERKQGFMIHDTSVFNAGFVVYKAPKKAKDESIEALIKTLEKRIDSAVTVAQDNVTENDVFAKAFEVLTKAAREVAKLTVVDAQEEVDKDHEVMVRESLTTGNVVDLEANTKEAD